MKEEIRYQDCPWYVRLWRRRWYLMVPIWTIQYFKTPWTNEDGSLGEESWNTWSLSYSIAVGEAQGKMRWYYTMDEVRERFQSRKK
jgi:hypothetical protein